MAIDTSSGTPKRNAGAKPRAARRPRSRTRIVGFLGFNGVAALDLIGPLEAFACAAGPERRYVCRIFGVSRAPFTSESGTLFQPHASLAEAERVDTLIVPGGAGLRAPAINGPIARWLRDKTSAIRRIASVCTGIYAVAPTGLLDGRRVTTHWRFAADVAERFPALRMEPDRIFVRDGRFYTSAGVTAAIDLALAMIVSDHGRPLAMQVARELVVYLKRNGGQDQYSGTLQLQTRSGDRLEELVTWMLGNLTRPLTVDALAERAGMSPRQLQRRFTSSLGAPVGDFVERLRLDAARERLSESAYSIDEVARLVGFRSVDVFRRAFVRKFGILPREYRERFELGATAAPPRAAGSGRWGKTEHGRDRHPSA